MPQSTHSPSQGTAGTLSPGSRLLRNLRDLQLDDELDWPNIQADTFDLKDGVQNQGPRIKKAEWVVFQLLQTWDPASPAAKEVAKLFPAYDPKQSLELRAALFAQLSALKKDGVLPKDLILRKTMFDDCKGPKFEDLLLALSVSVLVKVLSDDGADKSVVNDMLSSDSNPEMSTLQVLDLAYHGSLTQTLTERTNLRRRWQRFGRVLKMKEEEIAQRRTAHERKVEASKLARIPKRRLDRLNDHIEKDWQASNEWKKIITRGDQHLPQRTLLERPYDEVWQLASEEKLYKIQPAGNKSALQKFEQHIDQQNRRLAKWRDVKVSLERSSAKASPPPQPPAVTQRPATARRITPQDRSRTMSPELGTTEYELSISSPKEDRHTAVGEAQGASKRRSHKTPDSPSLALITSDLDNLSIRNLHSSDRNDGSPRGNSSGPRVRPTSMLIQTTSSSSLSHSSSPSRPTIQHKRSQTVVYSPQVSARPSLDRQLSTGSTSLSLESNASGDLDLYDDTDEALDIEDDAATSIINSVLNADPSPMKPSSYASAPAYDSTSQSASHPQHLSLTERARMSMAPPSSTSPSKRPGSSGFGRSDSPSKSTSVLSQGPPSPTREVGAISLDERTRQTIALMAAAQQQQNSQMNSEPRSQSNNNSSRPSTARRATVTKRTSRSPDKRPVSVRADTPELSFVDESLLGENVDEDTIFMSRPRIAHSPQLVPAGRDEDAESVEDFS